MAKPRAAYVAQMMNTGRRRRRIDPGKARQAALGAPPPEPIRGRCITGPIVTSDSTSKSEVKKKGYGLSP